MEDNVCCPLLEIIVCADTEEHKHLFCDSRHTIEEISMDNSWAKRFCLGYFNECHFYPKGEA